MSMNSAAIPRKNVRPRRQKEGASSKSLWKRICEHKILYLFMLPCVVSLLVFNYQPMYGATLAFKEYHYNLGILGSPWVGFEHFERFLTSPQFWITLKNTVIITSLKLLICFPAPIVLALMLNEMRAPKYKRFVQTMSYLPNFVSWVVVVQIMTALFSPYGGIINDIRKAMGLETIFFMGEASYFYPIVILSDLWKTIGWNSIIYLSALSSVSTELTEAAIIDGAGRLQIVWHVNLPAIRGTVGIMFIFAVGGILNAGFDQILLLQQPGNMQYAEVVDTFVLKTGLSQGKFEYATAIGLFKSLFSFLLVIVTNYVASKLFDISIW